MSQFVDLAGPGLFFALDCTWIHHAIGGMLSTLLLPVLMLAILVGIMGGDTKNIGELVFDVLGTALVVLIDLSVCALKFSFLLLGFILAALLRTLAEYLAARKASSGPTIKVKTGRKRFGLW
jgi:hypothetical protein